MARRWRGLLALAALLAAASVGAQTIAVAPSAAQRCLTRGELLMGVPAYPAGLSERKERGRVVVSFVFDAPDREPSVEDIRVEGSGLFEAAVRDFAAKYRVPCLEPGTRATLRQEFVFNPNDGRRVSYLAPTDADAERAWRLRTCVKHADSGRGPVYPSEATRRGHHGTVVLKMRFEDPGRAPTIDVLDGAGSRSLSASARTHAADFRMPCHEGAPVDMVMFYLFQFEGDSRQILADVPLATFLARVKGIQNANVYFDFNEMGCPFDVRLTLYQPYSPNVVGQVQPTHVERRFFLDWLQRQQLDLDVRTGNAVLGQETTITVPCTVLNLGASGGGAGSK